MKKLIMTVLAAALAGCATTGPATYGPSTDGRFGYEDMRIEENRYRVTYRGSGDMPPEIVEDYALRRAADIAVDNGYDWFRVVSRDISGESRGGVGIGLGVGSGSYGRRGGVGVGVSSDLGQVGGQNFYTVRLEALMGEGEMPDTPDAYDARDVLNTLGTDSLD